MQVNNNHALPVGYMLQEYEIRKVLSSGGFSFVYIARSPDKKTVAIKEYLPNFLALRTDGEKVIIPPEAQNSFRHGLKCFFEEGRALANIEHKNIVRVLNFFRANETVYMVMKYERGRSLQEHILSQTEPLSENFIRRVFSQLINGLREVHTQKLLHLDIKPANIYLRLDGSPVLLDFGSARQTLTNVQPTSPPSYTPGFASPEQFINQGNLGPWSDIYSVGATMYSCIARAAPVSADRRYNKDILMPASKLGKGMYSKSFLQIIDECMAMDAQERPQSMFALQKALRADLPTEHQNLVTNDDTDEFDTELPEEILLKPKPEPEVPVEVAPDNLFSKIKKHLKIQ